MEEQKKIVIMLVSGACCSSSLAQADKLAEQRLRQAIEQAGIAAGVTVVSLSGVLAGTALVSTEEVQVIRALFQKFGLRFAPAALVGKRVLFVGSAPAPGVLEGLLQSL